MPWDILAFVLVAQFIVVALLSMWGWIFLRFLLPELRKPTERSQGKRPEKAEPTIINGNCYVDMWEDFKGTIKAQKQKEFYRSDVEALMLGIEQEHLATQETPVIKAIRQL